MIEAGTIENNLPLRPPVVDSSNAGTGIRPLRIMHVVNSLGCGGTEFGVLKLLAGLDPRRFEHRLCTTRQYDPEFVRNHNLESRLAVAGTPDLRLQFPLFRLKRIFEQQRPDIVHTRNWGALEAVLAARLAGVPVIVHSEHGYEMDMLSDMPMRRRMFRRFAFSLTDAVCAVTHELRDYHAHQAWIQPERVQVMYNGVDTKRFCTSPDMRNGVRRELNLSPDTIVVGSVGRLVSIKDYGTLLRAAERVVSRGCNAVVLLVGAGPELEALQLQAQSAEPLKSRVIFAGASDRIPEMLNAMDIFVLPSLREGMSNTLLEAMATGLPIVGSNAGGNPEVLEEGRSGLLFAPQDTAGLADLLWQLCTCSGLRASLGAAARSRTLAHFSLDVMMQSYADLYHGLACQRGLFRTN